VAVSAAKEGEENSSLAIHAKNKIEPAFAGSFQWLAQAMIVPERESCLPVQSRQAGE
jgi:hypothetical protein